MTAGSQSLLSPSDFPDAFLGRQDRKACGRDVAGHMLRLPQLWPFLLSAKWVPALAQVEPNLFPIFRAQR